MKYQLPQAVISLKQGVGRLIRDEEDYGVVVLCDPRVLSKPYGKTFIKSLPNMLQTSSLDDAINSLELRESEYESVSH
jgi:ATP-dependent DNA helicase DinG